LALLTTPEGRALIRVIAGEPSGHKGPGSTPSPRHHTELLSFSETPAYPGYVTSFLYIAVIWLNHYQTQ
jgi:hypothetical protein